MAWYRGPLEPEPVVANPQPAYPSAPAALIYDPSTGMFDTSYAAAWEIGRLLTLANGPVASSLATWVATAASANRQLLETERTSETAYVLPAPGSSGTRRNAARQAIAEKVVPVILGVDGRRPTFGRPSDPAGLASRRMPSLLDRETIGRLLQTSDDLYGEIAAHVEAAARDSQSAPPTEQE